MLYSVDFTIKNSDNFKTIHTALIGAESVKECRSIANEIKENLKVENEVFVFIEA